MVPKAGFEPARVFPTTPSRWRVYRFHHFGTWVIICLGVRPVPAELVGPGRQAPELPEWPGPVG